MHTLLLLLTIAFLPVGGYESEVIKHWEAKDQLFRDKETSPIFNKKERKNFTGIKFYPPDSNMVVTAQYKPVAKEDTLEFVTSSGSVKLYAQVATLEFTINGTPFSLPAYQGIELRKKEGYEKYLFVPFTDNTSGKETYGGGRYLDLEIPDGDTLAIDFNYAYNPYCAYTNGYSCPIPKPESRLPISILAGEKAYH